MLQLQHGFSSVEEDTQKKNNDNSNNPPGFKSIKKFDSDGNFITKWGSEGYGDGQFWLPHDIAIDSSNNVYVVDSGNVHEKKNICAL
jgi:DNA-binding beta-propeller fold protein YncE